jgi:heptosyltransferase-1
VLLRRHTLAGLLESWRSLRAERYDFAADFQGLIKSALAAAAARPDRIFGFHHTQLRERAAALFYSHKTLSGAAHVVDKNLDLAAAAGAATLLRIFPLPAGRPEGALPPGDFVLASPLAGWRAKQWPIEHYQALAARLERELGIPLVLDGPPGSGLAHCSGLPGLIHATRRAAAVVGVDSGPLHLAAALGKPGVAVYGPTDPARNGPYGDSLRVLRSPAAVTTYKRGASIDESMRQVSPAQVFEALKATLGERRSRI